MIRLLAVAVLALAAGCSSETATGTFTPPPPSLVSPAASAPAPVPVSDPGRVTGSLAGKHCAYRGKPPELLPDTACTPGGYDPKITARVLCAPGYTTRAYRPPATGPSGTTQFKYKQAYPAYGVPADQPSELDHLISLELGGSNDATNLWPELGKVPNPKDTVENKLHDWVCASGITYARAQGRLKGAQQAIAADWMTALAVLGVK